jgi:hypothetical protein
MFYEIQKPLPIAKTTWVKPISNQPYYVTGSGVPYQSFNMGSGGGTLSCANNSVQYSSDFLRCLDKEEQDLHAYHGIPKKD